MTNGDDSGTRLQLYSIYHLNLMFSAVEVESHAEVIAKCYEPLLAIAEAGIAPIAFEASAVTLELVNEINPGWVKRLASLIHSGKCTFVGSGYSQLIAPLLPVEINRANLRIGNSVYQRLLGFTPHIALINEQAYSAGMIPIYREHGYDTVIMEWDNPFRTHSEWSPETLYRPVTAVAPDGTSIRLIWNHTIAFQKFQRYVHGELDKDEYFAYLERHLGGDNRTFPQYGNDAEIFDFRPGRFETEATLNSYGEWKQIRELYIAIGNDPRFELVGLDSILAVERPDIKVALESPEQPVPVKKQSKYNLTRWAVTGKDDLAINSACFRIAKSFSENPDTTDEQWKELCWLSSSDFRTHITVKRWDAYLNRLSECEKSAGLASHPPVYITELTEILPPTVQVSRNGRFIEIQAANIKVKLNLLRGLALDGLWFPNISDQPLVGTLHHGYYYDIAMGADYYTGHLVLETPGHAKITDLGAVDAKVSYSSDMNAVVVSGDVSTELGLVKKEIIVHLSTAEVELGYTLDWKYIPVGSFRLGHITLIPTSFDPSTLFYAAHNGGDLLEKQYLDGHTVDHTSPVSFLVSSNSAIGMTKGVATIGDDSKSIRVTIDKAHAAMVGMMTYRRQGGTYFCRLSLSTGEMDDTCRITSHRKYADIRTYRIRLSAASNG